MYAEMGESERDEVEGVDVEEGRRKGRTGRKVSLSFPAPP